MYKIITNPNKEEYAEITEMVVANDGYCPCSPEKSSDTKCMCKKFREQEHTGMCHCGRYKKIVNLENIVAFAKVRNTAKIPSKRQEDGCYDLYADFDGDMTIPSHTTRLIPTGIASAFSEAYRISIRERGSNVKSTLQVMAGQIDSGFRGEWFVALHNSSDFDVIITRRTSEVYWDKEKLLVPYNKAICQFAIEEVPKISITEIGYDELRQIESLRGEGCLGSSGK